MRRKYLVICVACSRGDCFRQTHTKVRSDFKQMLTATVSCGSEKLAIAHGVLAGPLVRLAETQKSILRPVPGSPVAPSELQSRSRRGRGFRDDERQWMKGDLAWNVQGNRSTQYRPCPGPCVCSQRPLRTAQRRNCFVDIQ